MKKIFQLTAVIFLLSSIWCFYKLFAGQQNNCTSNSCTAYVIGGVFFFIDFLLVFVMSFGFSGGNKNDEEYTNNRKELLRLREQEGKIQYPDITL